ncbi:MAG: succinate dehydrogenase, cytochrome b556 subunit [Sulfurimicrobium sp.]|nr:succinate dehydrogenase, cytochrome b556 subunit [Sulfurimicrobium sp.]MDP1897589.1 succinate dehydrogenase, cytochrome b556 subunit [Sulfurimicrobium sp.]MDP2963150.1 succinate dehydrogenase, cytochrome b556 subunit [Sulfurimicrobium sp.]MDZ7654599.1 succinate dehydrogenase, cytochrome b556 subunit [Sulfurimicrobium sp.]
MPRRRPVYLNLFKIRLPLPGIVSIMHRMSGALLFLLLPLLLYVLQLSLASEQGYAEVRAWLDLTLVKLFVIGVIWAYLHHFCMGLRYLALDFDIGADLPQARFSSKLVLAVSMGATILAGAWLW